MDLHAIRPECLRDGTSRVSVGDLDSNPFSVAPDGRFTMSASVEYDVTYCGSRASGSRGHVVSVRIDRTVVDPYVI